MSKIGILLTNTGTPDEPTVSAVRRYLREFLSDKRVVQLPRIVWLPLLYGVVLPLRSRRSTKLYQKIWTESGSPLRTHMQSLSNALHSQLSSISTQEIFVEMGMNYGNPSIETGIKRLWHHQVDQLIVFPLYPQYSNATVASSFDRISQALKILPALPEVAFLRDYADDPDYIHALSSSVKTHRSQHGEGEHLLISFHGVPESFTHAGDPYQKQCEHTATLLARELGLAEDQWSLCYQSRFGKAKWLEPATNRTIQSLATRGMKRIDIICPGFAVDCLETLEEIQQNGQQIFVEAGGVSLRYIPALNATSSHVTALAKLITAKLSG